MSIDKQKLAKAANELNQKAQEEASKEAQEKIEKLKKMQNGQTEVVEEVKEAAEKVSEAVTAVEKTIEAAITEEADPGVQAIAEEMTNIKNGEHTMAIDNIDDVIKENLEITSNDEKLLKEDNSFDGEVPLADTPLTNESILANLKTNLDSIEIEEANFIDRSSFTTDALTIDSTYQVIALRSGYQANIKGLTFKDRNIIKTSNEDPKTGRKKLYSIVYDKIASTSVGLMTFKDFLKITAFEDFDTLLYGILCQTYDKIELDITCGNCGKDTAISVEPSSMVIAKDDSVFEYINDILREKYKPIELLGKAITNKIKRVILPNSKIIVDLKTPSLEDHLNIMGKYNDKQMKGAEESIGTLIYVDALYVPHMAAIKAKGKAVYTKIIDFSEKFNIIQNLKLNDGEVLAAEIFKKESEYAVDYKIRSFPCQHCKEDTTEIAVNVENLLFFQISKAEQDLVKSNQTK